MYILLTSTPKTSAPPTPTTSIHLCYADSEILFGIRVCYKPDCCLVKCCEKEVCIEKKDFLLLADVIKEYKENKNKRQEKDRLYKVKYDTALMEYRTWDECQPDPDKWCSELPPDHWLLLH